MTRQQRGISFQALCGVPVMIGLGTLLIGGLSTGGSIALAQPATSGAAAPAVAQAPVAAAPVQAPPAAVAPAPAETWEKAGEGLVVRVASVTRTKHDTLKLRFVFKNNGAASVQYFPGAYSGSGRFSEVYLRNVGARIELKPLWSSGSGTFASDSTTLSPGAELDGWAEFPSVPATVKDLTVAFGTKVVIDDIPIN